MDPLIEIVSGHIMSVIEEAGASNATIHFDGIRDALEPLGIRVDEIDEALALLLQKGLVVQLDPNVVSMPVLKFAPVSRVIKQKPKDVSEPEPKPVDSPKSSDDGYIICKDFFCKNRINRVSESAWSTNEEGLCWECNIASDEDAFG